MFSTQSFAGDAGFGIFGAVGQASHDYYDIDESDTSLAFGGEYRFNTNFAIEARYDDFGTATYNATDEYSTSQVEYSSSAFSGGVKGMLPLSEQFSLFAKVGLSSWDIDGKVSATSNVLNYSGSSSESVSGTDFYYGFGGQFLINESLAIGLDYIMLTADIDLEDAGNYDINNLSLSLAYHF